MLARVWVISGWTGSPLILEISVVTLHQTSPEEPACILGGLGCLLQHQYEEGESNVE